jgi:hypothetical protein
MKTWIDVQIEMSKSFRRLGTAAVSRFGKQGKALQATMPAEVVLQKLKTTRPTQNGDAAEWRINPNLPTKMTCINGRWKLDLYSSFQRPEDISQQNDVFGRIVRAELKKQREALQENK